MRNRLPSVQVPLDSSTLTELLALVSVFCQAAKLQAEPRSSYRENTVGKLWLQSTAGIHISPLQVVRSLSLFTGFTFWGIIHLNYNTDSIFFAVIFGRIVRNTTAFQNTDVQSVGPQLDHSVRMTHFH